MDTGPQIRMGRSSDAKALVRFNIAMAAETEDHALDEALVTAGVSTLLSSPERGFYVIAEEAGELLASLMITREWSDWRNADFWWVQSVYVRPEHRRKGLYRALFGFVKTQASEVGNVCGFRLYVERENRIAQQTYAALGMHEARYLMFEAEGEDEGEGEGSS